eukprot:TRINITY_DN61554_c0_g1_i1.p1 TRINITY_DN61554_c0_g1~~TRINITY_DN61554_c0_g1_i1.p1  ORF type:complete len:686 (+),score=136.92 TRINITY_DN61554_c0_g1_i1:42-2099(+)
MADDMKRKSCDDMDIPPDLGGQQPEEGRTVASNIQSESTKDMDFAPEQQLSALCELKDNNIQSKEPEAHRAAGALIQVEIGLMSGKQFALEALASDTVADLKARIGRQESIPEGQKQLLLDGQALDDSCRPFENQWEDQNTMLQLIVSPPASDPTTGEKAHVTVKTLAGKAIELDIDISDTVDMVKAQIEGQEGIPADEQNLISGGKQLDGSCTLSECGIGHGMTIYLVRRTSNVQVIVKMLTGKSFELMVAPADTIGMLKDRIFSREGIPAERQRLIFAGAQLKDHCKIAECGIKDRTTIHLVTRLQSQQSSASSSTQAVTGSCDTSGACGLYNLGNTCYLNSILQALSNTLPLRRYYEDGSFKQQIHVNPDSMGGRLANSFAGLLHLLWGGGHTILNPTELKNLIAEKWPQFAGYQQHDSQELLMFLLDGLHEDVNQAPFPRPAVEEPAIAGKTELKVAEESWAGNLRRNDSKIMDIFGFQVRSEITFLDVGARSLKFEPMMYLSLPIPKSPNPEVVAGGAAQSSSAASSEICLEDCLQCFTQREELAEEDWVECEKTKQRERSLKKLDLWNTPECLIIHLKRFGSERIGGPVHKINTFVRFPMDLDLSPWVCGISSKQSAQYKLYAVVNHSGSLSFGHYTSHCSVGEGSERQWYHFNDSKVSSASESDVVSGEAYILFYERV